MALLLHTHTHTHTHMSRDSSPTPPPPPIYVYTRVCDVCVYRRRRRSRREFEETVFLHSLSAIVSPFVCTGYVGGRNANSTERKRREGGDLLDDLMQGNVSLIVTPKSWPLRATAIERERGVNAKTLGPAAERPRRRGRPEGRSD
jgi:hypothetical protein